jgi:hypothetical protein
VGEAATRKQHPMVLVADIQEAGWEPSRGGRGVDDARALCRGGAKALLAAIVPGLGGVWTDVVDGLEVVRLGHPLAPCPRALDPFDPFPLPENVFIRHWERMVFGRGVDVVWTRSGRLAGPLRWALAGQSVVWWAEAGQWEDWRALSRSGRASRGPLAAPVYFVAGPQTAPAPAFSAGAELERTPRESCLEAVVRRLERLS